MKIAGFNLDEHYQCAIEKKWRRFPAKMFLHEVDDRSDTGDEEVLGLSGSKGVLKRSDMGQRASEANSYIGYKRVLPGQLISNKMQAWNGIFGISLHAGITSPDYAVYRFVGENESRFIEYSLRTRLYAAEFHCRSKGIGTGFLRLNPSELLSTPFWLPDRDTQKAIADFLDRETARIDQLIEKKQRLVALLKECRSARITAAVTGQTDATSHAKSGTSAKGGGGVNMMRLRHMATITNSNVDKVTADDEVPVRLCNYVDVYKNDRITADMDFMSASATPTEIAKFKLEVGDVIITKDSEDRNDIAVPAYVSETASNLVCGYHLALLRAYPKVAQGDFLFWALQTKQVREAFSNAAGGVTRFGLTLDGMKSVAVPSPDLKTQKTIADYLDRETTRIDRLVEKTEQSINRLREHRAALITAAVTGQLDVTT